MAFAYLKQYVSNSMEEACLQKSQPGCVERNAANQCWYQPFSHHVRHTYKGIQIGLADQRGTSIAKFKR